MCQHQWRGNRIMPLPYCFPGEIFLFLWSSSILAINLVNHKHSICKYKTSSTWGDTWLLGEFTAHLHNKMRLLGEESLVYWFKRMKGQTVTLRFSQECSLSVFTNGFKPKCLVHSMWFNFSYINIRVIWSLNYILVIHETPLPRKMQFQSL